MLYNNLTSFGYLLSHYGFPKISEYKVYLDEGEIPLVLKKEEDCEPYLSCRVNYIVEDTIFDNIRYKKRIRILTPNDTENAS